MSEQPATTGRVRAAFAGCPASPMFPILTERFDLWFDQVKADAWDEAVDAAGNHIFSGHPGDLPNPYRRETER